MQVKIRKARKGDAPEIIPIWQEQYKRHFSEDWPAYRVRKKVLDYLKKSLVYVAVVEGKVVGFIVGSRMYWNEGYMGRIDEIFVSGGFQGKGVGTKLIEAVESMYRKKGYKDVVLFTNRKFRAMDFYRKGGYRETGFIALEKKL